MKMTPKEPALVHSHFRLQTSVLPGEYSRQIFYRKLRKEIKEFPLRTAISLAQGLALPYLSVIRNMREF
jgi:hypothetical protein